MDMSGFEYTLPGTWDLDPEANKEKILLLQGIMEMINKGYCDLVELGAPAQDARAVLPLSTNTSIIAKLNLRSLHDMFMKRLCTRAEMGAQRVARMMKDEVLRVHPWAEPFLRVYCASVGVCCFPNAECPLKGGIFNPQTGARWDGQNERPMTMDEIQDLWSKTLFASVPKMQ